jgi:hypothetical protein
VVSFEPLPYDFACNRGCFLGTLEGMFSCFKSQKKFQGSVPKGGASVLRGRAWTYTPPAASPSELTGGIPLLASDGRGLIKRKCYI